MIETVRLLADVLIGRVQTVRQRETRDLGASALEWAIIAAVAVVMAVLIGGIIYKIVDDKGQTLQNCGTTPIGDNSKC